VSTVEFLEKRLDARGDVESSLVMGERALHLEGDLQTGRWWFDMAYQAAEREGDGPALARAALGLGGVWVHEHRTAAEAAKVRARQLRALSAVDPQSPPAVRLRARLCAEQDYHEGRDEGIRGVLAEARGTGDAVAVAEALSLAHHCLMDPGQAALRLDLAQELIAQAAWTGRRGDLLVGLLWRTVDLFLAADPHAERSLAELRAALAVKDHLAVGFVVAAIGVMLAIRAGRFARAEELAAACHERGQAAGDADAAGWFGAQLVAIRWYQGRIGELVPALSELVRTPALGTADYAYFPALAVAAAAAGDRRLAAGMLTRLHGGDLSRPPRTKSWLAAMHGVVEAAFLLDDAATAAEAYRLLVPFAHLPLIASLGVACFGSAHQTLGMAALTTGELDRAVGHLGDALRANLALGHWPAAVLSRLRLGQALLLRRGGGDAAVARRHLALAEQEAAELGMTLPSTETPGAVRSLGAPNPVMCRRHGRGWELAWGDRTALVDDSVGMRHLATLLANPGREIRAIDLVAGPPASGEGVPPGQGVSGQPLLDEEARNAYRRRLAELEAEIDEFDALNNAERASAARAERDWLLAELAAAAGLGGRVRHFADGEERARIAVGKAIRRALTRIGHADPLIGEELRATVRTGLRCSYRPR
jgi:hypothetical protein